MLDKNETGIIIIKPPFAEDNLAIENIMQFIRGKFKEKFDKKFFIEYNKLVEDAGNLSEKLYEHLSGKWKDYSNMVKSFQFKKMNSYILKCPSGGTGFLKEIVGRPEKETNLDTIRGMMRKKYGAPEREWFNFVHVPHTKEIKRDLEVLVKLNIIPKGYLY